MGDVARRLVPALLLVLAGCSSSRGAAVRPEGPLPSDPAALIALADTAIAAADANAARRALDRALALAPSSAPVHLARGRYFTAIRRYKDAKAELDRAASLDPSSPEPHYLLGRAYLAGGETEAARSSLARAAALDPDHVGAREALAGLLEGRYVAAGIPGDYARLVGRPSVSRGELGVILAVELGVDPDRVAWRSGQVQRLNWPELDQAWGARWLRAAIVREWIDPYPDGSLRLDDPMTRGQLALLLARVRAHHGRRWDARADTAFVDLGARHYLKRAASEAVRFGLPLREGRFDPLAAASGHEALRSVRGLARYLGAAPVVRAEPGSG